MNCKIVAAIIVVVCIGDALAKNSVKSHSSPTSHSSSDTNLSPKPSSSSGSGSSHKRDKMCDAAPLFKKEEHCKHCCTDECGTCEIRERFETQKQYKWQCQIVKCPRPCDPSNGYVYLYMNKTCLGDTAWYYCDDDFLLSGQGNRTCQGNGTWSVPEPTCIPVVACPRPCPHTNGYIHLKPQAIESLPKVGTLAIYLCGRGFVLYGDPHKWCSENGTWLPILSPTCHPKRNCGNKWYMAYENDGYGSRLYGEFDNLYNAVVKGADARVRFPLQNVVAPLRNVATITSPDCVCGQIIFNWEKDGYDRFNDSAVWEFKMVCTCATSFNIEELNFDYGEFNLTGRNRARIHTQWFIRERCNNKPILTVTSDGSIESGSVSSVIGAVKFGQDIHVAINNWPMGYSVNINNIEYNDIEDRFTAMDIWQITSTVEPWGVIHFTGNPLWQFSLYSSSGMMRGSQWLIGDHILAASYSSQANGMNWYTNLCWDKIYQNDENGIALNEYDIDNLRDKASKGHRIKLMYNQTLIECTEVLLKGDHVCCTCFNKLSKSAIDEFPSDVNHIAEIVCTNGMINRLKTEIGSNIVVNGTFEEHASVSWFADASRWWTKVVTIDPTGGVIYGSKQVLIDAVEGGAAIRYKVQFGPQYFAIFEPDHIEIDGENSGAMFIRSIGMRDDNDFVLKYIKDRPYLSAHIMTTIGKMDKSKWTLGEHEPRGHEVEFHKADWFVNN